MLRLINMRRRSRRLFLGLVLSAGTLALVSPAIAAPGGPASGPVRAVDNIVGRYRFSGGARERKARDDAIDDVVRDMNIVVRAIARGRLKKANRIPARVRIERNAMQLTISLDGRSYTAPINGRSVEVTGITGDKLQMRYRVRGDSIEQIFQGDSGGRVNTYRADSRSRLRLAVRVFSQHLPKDLRYTLSYRRAK
jgi:hypothetical protein